MRPRAPSSLVCGLILGLAIAVSAKAVSLHAPSSPLAPLAFSRPELHGAESLLDFEAARDHLSASTIRRWQAYRAWAPGRWSAVVDRRTGRIALAEGGQVALHPGAGNRLTATDVAGWTGDGSPRDLAALARPAGRFLARVAPLLGVDATALRLAPDRSGRLAPHLWVLDYDLILDGRPLRNARVVLRINNGNLVQWGSENLPAAGSRVPPARLSREAAREVVARYIGGFADDDSFLDRGTLALLPATVRLNGEPDGYRWARGRRTMLVWELLFRRPASPGTWRARVDADTGSLLELVDTNRSSSVVGGVYATSPSDNETKLAMPFADVGGGVYANAAGYFAPVAGRSSTLQGLYVKINDRCGSILERADSSYNISFGTSGGTDCRTPGDGGGGNTHASRTEYYHLNRAKEAARGWLPTTAWLSSVLQANVNLKLTCDAYSDGTAVNFARSSGRPGRGCSNLGELPGVGLHELGHGLDANDGVPSPELGTGEAYADLTPAIQLQTSCIGRGLTSTPCTGYGNACNSCTGIRDLDWGQRVANQPSTVASFTQPHCPADPSYSGPCGLEAHCESYVASEAVWDLANRDLPAPGSPSAWATLDRLWFASRGTASAAFSCTPGAVYTSNGCNVGSWWKTMRAADDDDGDLSNGTPHSCALFAAFDRHGIACETDPGANVCATTCTPSGFPIVSLFQENGAVSGNISNLAPGVDVDLFRSDQGCASNFVRIADDLAAGSTFYDLGVRVGTTYAYYAIAHADGNEACAAPPTPCQTFTPAGGCAPNPQTPNGLVATESAGGVTLSWNTVGSASGYQLLRATSAAGLYAEVATPTGAGIGDATVACGTTYVYAVRATSGSSCRSTASDPVSVTTAPCSPQ